MQTATFGGGCFWCTEAVFQRLKGVKQTISGYTYSKERLNGYAESIKIEFDENEISFNDLLEVFFATHDPTSLNKQNYDVGQEYRSVIFAHNQEQLETANDYIKTLDESGEYDKPIVTEVAEFGTFKEAEDHHQDFYNKNTSYSYCQIIINPKLEKLYKKFSNRISNKFR